MKEKSSKRERTVQKVTVCGCTLHIDPKQGVGVKESKININQLDNGQGI